MICDRACGSGDIGGAGRRRAAGPGVGPGPWRQLAGTPGTWAPWFGLRDLFDDDSYFSGVSSKSFDGSPLTEDLVGGLGSDEG